VTAASSDDRSRGPVRERVRLGRLSTADLRLGPAAVSGWVTAIVLTGVPEAAGPVAAGGLMLAVGIVGWSAVGMRRRGARPAAARRRVVVLGAVALVCIGIAMPAFGILIHAPSRAPAELAGVHGRVAIDVTVTERAEAGAQRLRGVATRFAPLSASSGRAGEAGAAAIEAESPVLVLDPGLSSAVDVGERVRVVGGVAVLPPGETLAALVYADGSAVESLAEPPPWVSWGDALRAQFRELAADLPGDGGMLLTGLAIGDDSLASPDLVEAMRMSSLTHLTAVSGANCALVIAGVLLGGVILRIPLRVRIGLAFIALLAFVVLVTPQPSVVRAAVMATIGLVGLAMSRPASGVPLLSLAVIGIVTVDPWAGREFGFILSVLATAGLLVLAAPLGRVLARVMPRPMAMAIAIPAAAQLACQAVLVILDPTIPTYGVLANLLAGPAAPLATMLGLIACLVAPVLPPVATALAWLGWVPSAWIASVARTTAELPAAALPLPEGGLGLALVIAVSAAVSTALLSRGRLRRVAVSMAALLAVGQFAVTISVQVAGGLDRPSAWQYAMCDVGQGDAVLVRSGGRVALVDTGPEPERIDACLSELGISRIDLLVLTHFDKDHVGGADVLAGRVDRVIHGPADEQGERLLWQLRQGGAEVDEVARGASGILGAHAWVVLWPPARTRAEPGNDASVVIRFAGAAARAGLATAAGCGGAECLDAVLLGDLGASAQASLIRAGALSPTAIVKVSHHGSADQDPRLYRVLRPRIGLVGVGADNGYGHPTAQALTMLRELGTMIARTDTDGLVLVSAEGGGVVLWRSRSTPTLPADEAAP